MYFIQTYCMIYRYIKLYQTVKSKSSLKTNHGFIIMEVPYNFYFLKKIYTALL